jgi:hypothetical protein
VAGERVSAERCHYRVGLPGRLCRDRRPFLKVRTASLKSSTETHHWRLPDYRLGPGRHAFEVQGEGSVSHVVVRPCVNADHSTGSTTKTPIAQARSVNGEREASIKMAAFYVPSLWLYNLIIVSPQPTHLLLCARLTEGQKSGRHIWTPSWFDD